MMDAELTRRVRELIQTMQVKRAALERTLEEVQVSVLRVQIEAAELSGRAEERRLRYPAAPSELFEESAAAQSAITESHRLERHWRRAGISVDQRPGP